MIDADSELARLMIKGARLVLVLSLLFCFSQSTAQAGPALDSEIAAYTLWVPGGGKELCVGNEYTIPAEVRERVRVVRSDGTIMEELRHRGAAATIRGTVRDEAIGTLSPSAIQTGWDEDFGGRGRAEFSFQAKKPGQTTIYFEATVHDRVVDKTLSITVINCKYQVTMVAIWVFVGDGVGIWSVGKMQTVVGVEGETMKGTGSVKFNSGFSSDVCKVDYSFFQIPTTITGPLVQNDQLTLNFSFNPATLTNQVSCPVGGGSGTHTIDLTNLNMPPATFPSEGGSRVFHLYYAGSDAGDTTVIITVEPIE